MTLAERLKNERIKIGLSQKELADKLGMNARTYASYERGERDISTAVLLNICKTLNISSDALLGNDPSNISESSNNLCCDETDADLILLNRNAKKLSPENRKKLLEMAKVMFEEEFNDN